MGGQGVEALAAAGAADPAHRTLFLLDYMSLFLAYSEK